MKSLSLLCLFAVCSFGSEAESRWYDAVEQSRVKQLEGDYESSLQLLRAALSMANQLVNDDARVAVTLNNLGHVYQDLGRYEDAKQAYFGARKLVVGKLEFADNLTLANSFNITSLYIEMGKAKDAEKFSRKTFLSAVHTLPETHFLYAQLLSTVAAAHLANHRYAEADDFYTRSLNAKSRSTAELHQAVLLNRARARAALHRSEEARRDLDEGVAEFEKANARGNHPLVARFYYEVADVSASLGEQQKSENYYRKALDAARSAYGGSSVVHTSISLSYAKALRSWHRDVEAQGVRNTALKSYVPRSAATVNISELEARSPR